MASSPRPMRLSSRWLIAVTASIAGFTSTWWMWEMLRLPPAGSDRLAVALTVAAVVSAASGGPLFWWAAREREGDQPDRTLSTCSGRCARELIGRSAAPAAAGARQPRAHGDNTPTPSARRPVPTEHVFISYSPEDRRHVDQLQEALKAVGIPVWRDTSDVWPGEDRQAKIRHAIIDGAAFLACFSEASLASPKSYQNEQLVIAIEQLKLRPPDSPWLVPVRFDDCDVPDTDLGYGRTLASIQAVDLFGDRSAEDMNRLVSALLRRINLRTASPASSDPVLGTRLSRSWVRGGSHSRHGHAGQLRTGSARTSARRRSLALTAGVGVVTLNR